MMTENSANRQSHGETGVDQEIRFGVITPKIGHVQKGFSLQDGKLTKSKQRLSVTSGNFHNYVCSDLQGFADLIANISPNAPIAITLGIAARDGGLDLETEGALESNPSPPENAIARSKKYLSQPDGAKLVLIDVDPEPGQPPMTHSELWALLCEAVPALKGCGYLVTESSSSNLYDSATGECLRGAGGYHLYFAFDGDLEELRDYLKTKFWLLGKNFYKFSNPNRQTGVPNVLMRGPIDYAVFSPERIIYEAPPKLPDGVEQRRSPPIVVRGAILRWSDVEPLSEEESTKAKELEVAAKAAIKGRRVKATTTYLVKSEGLSKAEAQTEAKKRIKACDHGRLDLTQTLHLSDGTVVTVQEVLEAIDDTGDSSYNGKSACDPHEPDYNGGSLVAKIYTSRKDSGARIKIHSFAHGGKTWWATLPKPKPEIPWSCLPSFADQIGSYQIEEIKVPANEKTPEAVEQKIWQAKINPAEQYLGCTKRGDAKVHKFRRFCPKLSLDFTVSKVLQSSEGGALVLATRRREGNRIVEVSVRIKSSETLKVDKFVAALINELGVQVACVLSHKELQALLQNRRAQYSRDGGRTYRLIEYLGRQEDDYWVFEDCQFDPQGNPCTEAESGWVFNHDLGEIESIPSPKIAPQNPEAISNLIKAAYAVYPPQTMPQVLLILGYVAATMRHHEMVSISGGAPQLSLYGEAGGGKSLALALSLSLVGMHKFEISNFSISALYERAKSLSGLCLWLDDPFKPGRKGQDDREKLDGILWDFYGGGVRLRRGNNQQPRTNVAVTTNIALGEGSQAGESRLLKLFFASSKRLNVEAIPQLQEAMAAASGGIGQLLQIPYDRAAIKNLATKLLEFLPNAHARISGSLAIVVYFAQKVCDLAGHEFDAFIYCRDYLCPALDQGESGKDCLTDFFEKLELLRSEGVIGEWNLSQVTVNHISHLAVNIAAIFQRLNGATSPTTHGARSKQG